MVCWLWCRFPAVSEQEEVIADLDAAGVLAGIRWAYVSAGTRVLETHSEDDGDDAALLGSARFTRFRDRLDRVFACERYAVRDDGDADLDVLYAELSERDIETMPRLAPDLVRRSNLNGSPGWAHGGQRFLLASCVFGKIDRIPWPQKSQTKRKVARQHNPEPPQPSLFDDFAEEEVDGLAALTSEDELDMVTFVVGHSLDQLSQQIELVFGRPRLNTGGGRAWEWRHNLLGTPPADGGRRSDDAPPPNGPDTAPDAPVRLRRRPAERHDDASGEQ
jgi:hypothetical protein